MTIDLRIFFHGDDILSDYTSAVSIYFHDCLTSRVIPEIESYAKELTPPCDMSYLLILTKISNLEELDFIRQ